MKPYYEQDEVTIYHGATREILPALGPLDALMSDPPCPNAYADIQGKEDPEGLLLSILVCKKIRRHQGVNRWIITIARKAPRGMPGFQLPLCASEGGLGCHQSTRHSRFWSSVSTSLAAARENLWPPRS